MITRIHIFYTDAANGWCEQALDAEGNQIGKAAYHYRKVDAITSAKGEGVPVHIFGKNGLFQRIA
jgi:hypothetical protein